MISLLHYILSDASYVINESNGKIIIYKNNSHYPEDYVEITKCIRKNVIYEGHRKDKILFMSTEDDNMACVYAAILCKRLFDIDVDRKNSRMIKEQIDNGKEKLIVEFIKEKFKEDYVSFGNEMYYRISFLKEEKGINVKYAGEYLAKNVSLSRGYVVLYNYCEKMKVASDFFNKKVKALFVDIDMEQLMKLYLLGRL